MSNKADEPHAILQAQIVCQVLQLLRLIAFPCNDQTERLLGALLHQQAQGSQSSVNSLLATQAREHPENECLGRYPIPCARCRAARGVANEIAPRYTVADDHQLRWRIAHVCKKAMSDLFADGDYFIRVP